MKNSVIVFSAASLLLTSLFVISVFKIGLAAALTDATSTITGSTTAPALPDVENASTTPVVAAGTTTAATSSATAAAPVADNATSTAASSTSQGQGQSQSQGASAAKAKPTLKLVHVVGSKYIDYFTDGTTTYSFPGDPTIDANLNKPNASTPFHAGLTWVSSKGMEAYDTASGDLEPGTYTQEADGSFIVNAPDATDATSSTNAHISFSKLDPTLDVSAPAPAAASGTSTASTAPTDLNAPATVPASDASTTTSASTTPIAPAASTTPSIPSATTTPLASSASSTTTSSTTASTANDNAASSTSATSTAE